MYSKKELIGKLNKVIESKDDSSSEENKKILIEVRDALSNAKTRDEILSAAGKLGPYFLKLIDIFKDHT